VHDSLMASEMSQHERASSWLDNLPQTESSPGDAAATHAAGRCAGAGDADLGETRAAAHDPSSRTVSYDDKYTRLFSLLTH